MTRALPFAAIAALLLTACGAEQQAEDPVRPVLTMTVAPGASATVTSTEHPAPSTSPATRSMGSRKFRRIQSRT